MKDDAEIQQNVVSELKWSPDPEIAREAVDALKRVLPLGWQNASVGPRL